MMGSATSSSALSSLERALESSSGEGARPFGTFDMSDARAIVDGIPDDRRIVLLGESTHGTEEFYRTRAEVTKRLIEERGFTAVCFEADFPYMKAAEKYIRGERATPFPLDGEGGRFPVWMWGNQCMSEWFDWCKDSPVCHSGKKLNSEKSESSEAVSREVDNSVRLFGIDCYSLFESKRAVVSFLEQHDTEFAREAVDRLAFLDKFKDGHEYGEAAVHGNLSRIAGHLQEVLTKIQARLQWGSDKYNCSPAERLAAEQNCEVIIAADEYYRKCVSEPAGSQASWNARDQHMTTTLLRIQAHLGNNTKIIVWAHNSHVGDSTATNRGGDSFDRNETWNLGQMVRATFGPENVWIVGQYTYGGQVMAAEHWGGKHKARDLRNALPESYEAAMHQVHALIRKNWNGKRTGNESKDDDKDAGGIGGSAENEEAGTPDVVPFYFHTEPFVKPSSNNTVQKAIGENHPIALSLAEMMTGKPRLQRWVGVSYKRDNERRAHYGELSLHRCYDMVVFVDKTEALAPIAPKVVPQPRNAGGAGASKEQVVQSTRSVNKRLLKEYRRLLRSSPPGIEAHPLESNILEWHFVLRCSQAPYAGGEYHGTLTFPKEYPMRPPRFKVLTPSGRFEPGERLCLSMSDYHPESWNPAWSVETLLVGLLSFMYEESNAIGSLSRSAREREKLAKKSHKFNRKNKTWCEIFGGGEGSYREADDDDDDDDSGESVCRFCFTSEGELISPCMCKGSNEWVHLECLRKWQKEVLLTQPTHPKYQTHIDRICNICLEPFTGVGIPPSRHEQVRTLHGMPSSSLYNCRSSQGSINKVECPQNLTNKVPRLHNTHSTRYWPLREQSLLPWCRQVIF